MHLVIGWQKIHKSKCTSSNVQINGTQNLPICMLVVPILGNTKEQMKISYLKNINYILYAMYLKMATTD